jgi:hypothetical protein
MRTWGCVKCILNQTLKGQHSSEGQRAAGEEPLLSFGHLPLKGMLRDPLWEVCVRKVYWLIYTSLCKEPPL